MVFDDLRQLLGDLEQEHQMAPIGVELVDNELAKVYANSNKGQVS
jgi:transcription elongation factor SPT6